MQWAMWESEAPCEKNKIGRRTMQSIESKEAWDVLETLDIQEILGEKGGDLIVALMDEAFNYNEDEELHDALDKVFECEEKLDRVGMREYIMEQRGNWSKLTTRLRASQKRQGLRHDWGFPEEVKGYWLLKKSGLAKRERRQVLASTNQSYTWNEVSKALRSMYAGRLTTVTESTKKSKEQQVFQMDDRPRQWLLHNGPGGGASSSTRSGLTHLEWGRAWAA